MAASSADGDVEALELGSDRGWVRLYAIAEKTRSR
jgi:hypothetical protein